MLDLKRPGVYVGTMDERKASLTPLKEILDRMFKEGGLPFDIRNAKIWDIWDDVVGRTVARHARPVWIKQCLLRVAVSDPIWLQELRFQEREITKKLNQQLGRKAVARIEFRLRQ